MAESNLPGDDTRAMISDLDDDEIEVKSEGGSAVKANNRAGAKNWTDVELWVACKAFVDASTSDGTDQKLGDFAGKVKNATAKYTGTDGELNRDGMCMRLGDNP
jgi:hypothetical protein